MNINFFSEDINKSVQPGVYQISFLNDQEEIPFYIGESCFIVLRAAQHLGKFFLNPESFGLTKANLGLTDITIKFKVLSIQNDRKIRLKQQRLEILEKSPLSQIASSDRLKNRKQLKNDVKNLFKRITKVTNIINNSL